MSAQLLEALAKAGRLDAEEIGDGSYKVGGVRVRMEMLQTKVVLHVGDQRTSIPRTGASWSKIARLVVQALGAAKEPPERLSYRIVAGRTLYLARGSKGDALLVLAASEGTAQKLAAPKLGSDVTVTEATESENGRHESVLCEDGVRRPIAVVFSALASLR